MRCRVCQEKAVYVLQFHDGAKVPYCKEHLPDLEANRNAVAIILRRWAKR